MRLLFWGTPAYAVGTLSALHSAGHNIVGVVTQPDRRRGRGKKLVPSPVKERAQELGCPVFTPERIRDDLGCQKQLAQLQPDASIVVAFGQILPREVLQQPPLGCWNGHGSLLPRWRGAGPIQWALLEGDSETGVGIMAMEEGLDTGPVLVERKMKIALLENADQLGERMSRLTAELMVEALPHIETAGPGSEAERWTSLNVRFQTEDHTYARMLSKADYQIDWSASALSIHRRVMGLYPGAQTSCNGRRLKVQSTEPLIERLADQLSPEAAALIGTWPTGMHEPGTILAAVQDLGIVVSTTGCPLLIRDAQFEGKSRSRGQILVQQMQSAVGSQLG